MRTVGIVVEYNPMHNGHAHHLAKSREICGAGTVVAVMSGYFLQRGEPALVDKWTRTRMALENGVDLVLELPLLYTIQSAAWFAYGAVATLDALGVVDALCFGSECGNLAVLQDAAMQLAQEPPDMSAVIRSLLASGETYPKAVAGAFRSKIGTSSPLDSPNNVLGIEYIKALHRLGSRIQPFTIPRYKAGYHDTNLGGGSIASATAIRKYLLQQGPEAVEPYLPGPSYRLLRDSLAAGRCPVTWETFFREIRHAILSAGPERLQEYHHIDGTLARRLFRAALSSGSVEDILRQSKSKNVTRTKLQRALAALFLQLKKEDLMEHNLDAGPTYIRVLGFSDRGQSLLSEARQRSRLPLVTRVQKRRPSMMEWDLTAARLYALGAAVPDPGFFDEFLRQPLRAGATDNSARGNRIIG